MKTLKLAVIAIVALAFTAGAQAQDTNVVQTLSIQLFGYSQGGVSKFQSTVTTNINVVRVDTRQIIQALATATLNSFSSTSKLVVVTPLGGGDPSVQVRDGDNTPVDVSDLVTVQSLSDSVEGSVVNTKTGRGSALSYQIVRVALQDNVGATLNLHFDVNGIATSASSIAPSSLQIPTIDANVSGSGDRNGNVLILQGSIEIFGRTLEVDSFTGST
ncbi:MAG TPA: hypothetical protein VG938_12245 [Verrucomicrobiae bacterium]|jgi:hypothetical protein|nr:hypothetical protein [Verrucomicrobiae bacterium]